MYSGESICQGIVKSKNTQCTNKAYYVQDDKYYCGVHSKKDKRTDLPINPNKDNIKKEMLEKHFQTLETVKNDNKNSNKKGTVTVQKMYMMKQPKLIEGYLNVYPNYKHQNRSDGFGCPTLSPKYLGPVIHNMPNLPEAKNIENYHQFAKFWDFELDKNNIPTKEAFQNRIDAYNNPVPYRHKHSKDILKKYGNINIPKFSIYYDVKGTPHYYNYLQCRYFYCHFYELLVQKEDDFKKLKDKVNNGYNICIVGYDGYVPSLDLNDMYNDTSKPFGHEMVLYTMLIEDDISKYPWNIYYQNNKNIYKNVI